MPIYEPEDFDKMADPKEISKAKKEALEKKKRLEEIRQREIAELESIFNSTE